LVVEAKICNEYFENCSQVAKNYTNFKSECHRSIARNTLSCINVVQHVRYDFYHNGTYGIVKANVLLILKNISFAYVKNIDFSQTVEVKFMWWNHTLNYSSYLSGNPGYLIGMPVLTAELISVNISVNNTNSSLSNSTHYNQLLKLFRNPSDFTNNFMVLPSVSLDGICVLNKHKYTAVEFGFNLYTKCKINDYILNKNLSAKNMCINIQQTIFKYWSLETTNNTLGNKLIGQFGNANVHNIDEWLNVMYRDDLNVILNTTWGKFDKKMNTLSCGNITTLLTINFYHSRIDFEDVINQEKILGVVFHFNKFKNITFPINFKEKYFYFTVQTGAQIGFFDITTKKIRKLVDPPSLNIKLPHDFFYPFVKINNDGVRQMCLVHFIFVSVIFVLLVK
jgi:tectonic-1/3